MKRFLLVLSLMSFAGHYATAEDDAPGQPARYLDLREHVREVARRFIRKFNNGQRRDTRRLHEWIVTNDLSAKDCEASAENLNEILAEARSMALVDLERLWEDIEFGPASIAQVKEFERTTKFYGFTADDLATTPEAITAAVREVFILAARRRIRYYREAQLERDLVKIREFAISRELTSDDLDVAPAYLDQLLDPAVTPVREDLE